MVVAAGADLVTSNGFQLGILEQADRLSPQAAIATTRFMTTRPTRAANAALLSPATAAAMPLRNPPHRRYRRLARQR
jgi:hypothetical protein